MRYYTLVLAMLFCIGGCDGDGGAGGGGGNVPPTLIFANERVFGGDVFIGIRFTATDPDSAATITFFADTDQFGFDGFPVVDINGNMTRAERDQTETFSWDTIGISEGLYFIYGTISDGVNPTVTAAYRYNPVIVCHSCTSWDYPAYAVISFIPSGQSGLISIQYDLWVDGPYQNLLVEYRGGSAGASWVPATVQGQTTLLETGPQTIFWDSAADEFGVTANDYEIRISAQNAGTGVYGPPDMSDPFEASN